MPVINETTDATANTSTGYSMSAGDYFFGDLSTGIDSDWVEVALTAGQTYTFATMGTGALDDAANDLFLRLRNASGTQIDDDDDGGPGRNSTITFTASSSGTYYLDVGSYVGVGLTSGDEGTYGLSMTTGNIASYDVTMGAGNLLRPSASWASNPGTGATVTWAIRSSGTEPSGGNTFIAPSAAQVSAIEETMGYLAGVSGLTFNQVNAGGTSNNATMLFGGYNSTTDGSGAYAYYPGSTTASANAGDVWLNNNSVSQSSLPLGSFSHFVMLHEIGHALGLAHPGDYNAAPGVSITYANSAQFIQDSHQYTVMSYFDQADTGGSGALGYPDTLMLFDLLALHQQHGADNSYNAGATTYGFNATVDGAYDFTSNTTPLLSIWDGGGEDTIDLSGYSMAQTLTLEAGEFSDVGGYIGNLSIAIGAVIENAIGGSGNDAITGNSASNALSGNQGDDTLAGGAGTDTLIGGRGADSLVGGANDDAIYAAYEQVNYWGLDTLHGGAGNDTLLGTNGTNFLYGDEDDDYLNGGNDRETAERDRLYGGSGNDTLESGQVVTPTAISQANGDRMYGGTGNDLLIGGLANDYMLGQEDNDTLLGGGGDDELRGGRGTDSLEGGAGNDLVTAAYEGVNYYGQDTLRGGTGNDTLIGTNGANLLYGDEDDDFLTGGNDRDTSDQDTLYGGSGNDTLESGQVVTPNAETQATGDLLFGGTGNDMLTGGLANDTLEGGDDNDTMDGGGGSDVFVFADGFGTDEINNFDATDDAEKIDLSGLSTIGSYAQLATGGRMTQQGSDVVIDDFSGNTITLTNVTLAALDDADFLF